MPFQNGVYSLPFRIGTNTPTEPQYSGQVGADFDEIASIINNGSIYQRKELWWLQETAVPDDTAAIQAAVDASGGGTIFFPKGGYLVSDAITCTEQVILLGEGRDKSIIFCAGNDCTLIDLSGRDLTIMQLGFNGSQDFGATNAAIIIRAGANNCHIENNFIQFGRYCILNLGTDNTFFNNEMRYAYGSALMKSVGSSGIFIFRNKMDQVWPDVIPADGYTVNAWASGTVYAQGDVVTT